MAGKPLEDYALIGDCQTAALISRDGSIDWACLPRFDSAACFSALLGDASNGSWRLSAQDKEARISRTYADGSLILTTHIATATGSVEVIDFMPIRGRSPDIARIVRGISGEVAMSMALVPRFGYGRFEPWTRCEEGAAGSQVVDLCCAPDRLRLVCSQIMTWTDDQTSCDFSVRAGHSVTFILTWYPAHEPAPPIDDPAVDLATTRRFWHEWSSICGQQKAVASLPHHWRQAVEGSLVFLKAMTYQPTGGLIAAVTTSLPEELGGERNWDYRFCWIRDAMLSVNAMVAGGHVDEAEHWQHWLLRVAGGRPEDLQTMYGVAGERILAETELPWLKGHEGASPVRTGNQAAAQFQLGIYGDVLEAMYVAVRNGVKPCAHSRFFRRRLANHVAAVWRDPDSGIWEVRGPRQHFTSSKAMAWVAIDRTIRLIEMDREDGTSSEEDLAALPRWRALSEEIHADICHHGYDEKRGVFVQVYSGEALDASLLKLPDVGFLPLSDPRMRRTVEAIERTLVKGGLVRRYITDGAGGTGAGEGAFLACSFWLVDCLTRLGRTDDAVNLFEKLLALRNDVGLIAEEYDTEAQRQVGNYPQAFSHLSLISSAMLLSRTLLERGAEGKGGSRVHHAARLLAKATV